MKKKEKKRIQKISSFEKLLLGLEDPNLPRTKTALRKNAICPQCKKGRLNYNGLLQLACSLCGFTNGEAGGCT